MKNKIIHAMKTLYGQSLLLNLGLCLRIDLYRQTGKAW